MIYQQLDFDVNKEAKRIPALPVATITIAMGIGVENDVSTCLTMNAWMGKHRALVADRGYFLVRK